MTEFVILYHKKPKSARIRTQEKEYKIVKKLSFILILCLLLCGCGKSPAPTVTTEDPDALQTEASGTQEAPTADMANSSAQLSPLPEENSVWAPYSEYENMLGIVLNEPVENPPRYTTVWMEGEFECGYIIPRFVGSYVNLYQLEWSEDFSTYTLADEPSYSTLVGDGCVIYSVLPRPEGFPTWYLEIISPDGKGDGWVLQYDGRDGTAPIEFFEYLP